VILLAVLAVPPASAHKQHVHKYIAREAYLLLRDHLGGDVPLMQEHVGGLEQFFDGDSAWQRPFITTGSWREDEEDVVFHHDLYEISPGLNYALVSITHFWDADQGDLVQNMFTLRIVLPPFPPISIDIGPYENAWQKFSLFAAGGWPLWYPRAFEATNTANGHTLLLTPLAVPAGYGVPISYNGLTTFFLQGQCTLRTDENITYTVYDQTAGTLIDPHTVGELLAGEALRDNIVWEVLGRMCHLLADMSVPAHAHRDEHGLNPDSYEEYAGGPGDPYMTWNHQNAGPIIDPPGTGLDRLHFLFYDTQQIADHFGSNGPADGSGNNIAGGNPRPAEIAFLDSVNLASLGPPTDDTGPWTADNLLNIGNQTLPVAIRATAGLLLWFFQETRPLGTGEQTTDALPVTVFLEQNYPNPFNGETRIGYRVKGTGEWEMVELKISDVLGREVAVLVRGLQEPGRHEVAFDAARLASGVYVCRLEAAGGVQTRRMLLIR
jgi:hypothetical protein